MMAKYQYYLTDQNHPAQAASLPNDAVPGYVASVWRGRKQVASFWSKYRDVAERMLDEYQREYEQWH